MKFQKKFILLTVLMIMMTTLSGCLINDLWNSVKDRYKPFEFIGQDGDKVIVKFTYDSPSSTEVWLSGQFNGWAASKNAPKFPDVELTTGVLIPMKMDPKTQYWTVTVPLAPGRYQYKYVLDGGLVWQQDMNTDAVDDGFGGKNSIIVVTK